MSPRIEKVAELITAIEIPPLILDKFIRCPDIYVEYRFVGYCIVKNIIFPFINKLNSPTQQ
jgi:hypothetical protein